MSGGEIGDWEVDLEGGVEEGWPEIKRVIFVCVDYFKKRIMTVEELLERYAAGERDFSGVDLSDVNLSGADLLHINLSGANLSRANLVGARLYGADIRQCNLSGADLRNADLRVSRLDEVNFQDTNLQGANWRNAERCGAFFCNTTMPDGEIVIESNRYEWVQSQSPVGWVETHE